MFFLRRCNHLARRQAISPSWSRNLTSQARCISKPWPSLRVLSNTSKHYDFSTKRLNSTTPTSLLEKNGFELPIDNAELSQIITRAEKVWPAPAQIPTGWSSTWSQWPYLLTFYWLSPYFLMLPQIEMVLNIQHGIPGEARPLFFSRSRGAFVFTIVPSEWASAAGGGFYLLDGAAGGEGGGGRGGGLWRFEGVRSEEELLTVMLRDPELVAAEGSGALVRVPVSEEGEAALARVLERDETVIPVLAEKFLDYVPEATRAEEEACVVGAGVDEEQRVGDEEGLRMMEGLVAEIEEKLAKDEKESDKAKY